MQILDHWTGYFKERHEGLGTTYERFILHRYFERLKSDHGIESVLEAPTFGMTGVSGINSLWWARQEIPVMLVDHDPMRLSLTSRVWREVGLTAKTSLCGSQYDSLPIEDKAIDMAWNFAALIFLKDTKPALYELARIAKKLIFICIPNQHNIAAVFRKKSTAKHTNTYYENSNPDEIARLIEKMNWKEIERGFLDIPPWPDIAMNKEDMLRKIGLAGLASKMRRQSGKGMCILDFFSGENKSMERDVLKFAFFEKTPAFIRRFWAHHQYLIFTPKSKPVNK